MKAIVFGPDGFKTVIKGGLEFVRLNCASYLLRTDGHYETRYLDGTFLEDVSSVTDERLLWITSAEDLDAALAAAS